MLHKQALHLIFLLVLVVLLVPCFSGESYKMGRDISTGNLEEMLQDSFGNPIPILGAAFDGSNEHVLTFASTAVQEITGLAEEGIYALQAFATSSTNDVIYIHVRNQDAGNASVTDTVFPVMDVEGNRAGEWIFRLFPTFTRLSIVPNTENGGITTTAFNVHVRRLF